MPPSLRDDVAAAQAVAAGRIPFHGAAIESDGRVAVLAGASGAGKSTLGAAAVLGGWGFVADEVAAVSPTDRLVHPFHRPIGMRRAGADALGLPFPAGIAVPGDPVDLDPGSIGRLSPGGLLHTIVLVEWQPDAESSMSAVESAQGMVELLQHLVVDDDAIAACFRGVDELVRTVPIMRLSYTTPAHGVDLLNELIRR